MSSGKGFRNEPVWLASILRTNVQKDIYYIRSVERIIQPFFVETIMTLMTHYGRTIPTQYNEMTIL